MEQITEETVREFIRTNEIELKSTHSRLSLPIINRLARKMTLKLSFPSISVCEGMIINGHHRYVASLLTRFELGRVESKATSATSVEDWNTVDFIDVDYDSVDEIQAFNVQDAAYNNLTIEELVNLLNNA